MDRDQSSGSSNSSWLSFEFSDDEKSPSPARPLTRDMGVQVTECNPGRCVEICLWPLRAFESRANQIETENHLQQEEIQYGLRQENDNIPTLAMSAEDFVANMLQRIVAVMRQIFATEGARNWGINTD